MKIYSPTPFKLWLKSCGKNLAKKSITLVDQRIGLIIHSPNLSKEEGLARLKMNDERNKRSDQIRSVASYLRSQILEMPKSKTPQPANMVNLKKSAPELPKDILLFYETLLGDLTRSKGEPTQETTQRKVDSLASDAVYVSRGSVKPWKNGILGLGLSAITGSKLSRQVLNRQGHCINYSEVKALETELAFSVVQDG